MDHYQPHTREEYQRRNLKKMTRNHIFAANKRQVKPVTLKRVMAFVAMLVVSISLAYGGHLYFALHSAVDSTFQGGGATSQQINQKRPISILILGVDQGIEGRHDRGNSDTMIVATINPEKKTSTLTSIPRDLLADIKGDSGKYFMFRVNSAYQVGGNQAATKTTSALLNIPIDYYMEVNMKALEQMVDAVGGVDVNVPFSFTYNTSFHKGKMHLNGKEALDYARMRHDDPRGDYGRQMRQRQIIMAIVKNAMSLKSLANAKSILKAFSKNVTTNLTFNDMWSIALNYRDAASNMKSDYIHGHDAWIDGASIQVASTKEYQRISDTIRTNLGLSKEKLSNEETRQNRLNKDHIDWTNPNAFTNYQVYDSDSD
ncbi:LCP family protein [Lactobacillus psittaci]|uniref:Transcription regulator n=1 Tax=Lactobacillus psittaci DSM 15354 TaxID=1122152 RepID=A0A0R1S499_9LACO|nr:LCP family protein [Lactobacillus psittaci]KRL63358.1 transcription regulator [Lactobacillus psittaci DSM 15354]